MIQKKDEIYKNTATVCDLTNDKIAKDDAMCSECKKIEKKIERFDRLRRDTTDDQTIAAIDGLIVSLEDQKIELHSRDRKRFGLRAFDFQMASER